MNIPILRNLFIFILLISGHPSFAQSINDANLQKLLIENPSIINNIPQQDKTTFDQKLISENQNVANTGNNLQINLSQAIDQREVNEKSMLMRYFYALIGEELNIYGSNEFNQPQDESLLFFNTIGKNYQLAPGDTIQVTITGLSPSNENYQVMNDGTITLENVYPLNVNNLNLNQVSKLVLDKILLDDASAEVFVRLNNARLVTVQISGNVKSPRTIAVPAYTPLSRVIAYSGGISDSGSLRNISLSQIGETTQTVDFYNFLQNASPKLDPLIKNGSRIFVPFKGPTIAVTGFVNKPGIYELPSNEFETTINELLSISGTSFIPSGSTLKVSYFDTNGQIATRLVLKDDFIKEGEALQVEFIESRNLNISKVSGAVLKDYEIKINTPVSIREVLKDGAVLTPDVFKPLALAVGKDVHAFNLGNSLEDDSILLPVGSDLILFTKEEYKELVSQDPNESLDPFVSKFVKSNIAEIYLNGQRVAYVPVDQGQEFHKYITDFYTLSPKTVYDLALLEKNTGVEAIDLKLAMRNHYQLKLGKGDRLFIFEDKFFKELIKNRIDSVFYDGTEKINNTNTENINLETLEYQQEVKNKNLKYSENLNYSRKILQKANLIKISLDGELFSILPFSKGMTSLDVSNKLKGRLPRLLNEFLIVENTDSGSIPKIKNTNYEFKINKNDTINFISRTAYQKIINNYDFMGESALINDVRESDAVRVYYNEKLALLLSPNIAFSQQKILDKIINSNNFYELYIGFSTKQKNNNKWTLRSYDAATFFSDSQNIIPNESDIVFMFSEQYIRDKFINSRDKVELIKNVSTNTTNNKSLVFAEDNLEINSLDEINTILIGNEDIDAELRQSNNDVFDYVLKSMSSNLRFISGAIMFPGSYPLADKVRLKDLVDVAGLINSKASSNIVVTRALKENDILVKSTPEVVKLNSLVANEIILSGEFYVDVPKALNEAVNGFINLSGEFMKPGDYAFARTETLSEIIQRAGGLAETAYPLGAVLERISIKDQEKLSNNILAGQLEASVLTLAQSDIEGVGDQIKAVLGFAQQLRSVPTTGRMTINLMDTNNNLYLQDGDKLMLPKRPSHVSVIGAVQRTTVARYSQNSTYKDYISSAGGLTKMADIRKTYLLLPNGESRLLDNNTIIPVGSVIVVPPKIDKLSILGLTDIVSRVLGNIATSILAINNVN
ncbi:SLBB domain-containing protein [Amylibacter sp.]|nr:SLBB domain-containing protein [Amylibacter sp.]